MRATVIIPCHDRVEWLRDLLISLRQEGAPSEEVEVIVVDDASTEPLDALLQSAFPNVRFLRSEERISPAAARNKAAKQARGRLLLFLDADGVVAPGWLQAMLSADDGSTVLLGVVKDFTGKKIQIGPRRATFLGKSLPCRPSRANVGGAGNLGVPQRAFAAVGGFDEELGYYFEDTDLCIRLARAGTPFLFMQEAVFLHRGTTQKRGEAVFRQERNSTYAMLKHYQDSSIRRALFLLTNAAWCLFRYSVWYAQGRREEATLLRLGFIRGIHDFQEHVRGASQR